MSSKAAVLRVVPDVRAKLSAVNVRRLDQVLELIDANGKAGLADVLKELYPRQDRTRALSSLRQLRREISLAATEAGVKLSLETDTQTRSHPRDRQVWFEGEDRITEDVMRLTQGEISDLDEKRTPQDVQVERPVHFFVSYAHDDTDLKKKLLSKLKPLLDTHADSHFEIWSDMEILPGKKWFQEIQQAMQRCDFGLLLVSPAFLSSKFIQKHELPYLLENKLIIPVGLKPVLFGGSMDLKGLEERQVFRDDKTKTFIEKTVSRTQEDFALQLFKAICKLLAARSAAVKPERPPARAKYDFSLRQAIGEFDEERHVHTEGVLTTFDKGEESAPEFDRTQRKDAIQFLMEWITNEKEPPYCALLGETGLGKTTTCKALARELLDRREKDQKSPLPIYFDLRHIGKSAQQELVLDQIIELVLRNSWKSGPEATSLTASELIRLAQDEGALVIWDGLDEVLVHLDPGAGQKFTRQLFRILPPARKGESRRGRMLITCRTHYFRTLRDQQTHFRGEDRDNIRREDYRPPFLLLPFTTEQIRKYLAASLPDEDPERVMEVLKTVHNLTEMAERPYTLSLITEHFARIEKWKAEGRRVTGLMLYREMVLSWLERDQGKHHLVREHKQELMEYFAAELWRAGERFWSIGELEQWLIDFLRQRPDLAAHYEGKDRELLKEDLRTATFLVREGEDRFRFAHTSLQEYFLAGYLRRALVENRPQAWELKTVSPETLDFLGQWLCEEKKRDQERALLTLAGMRDTYRSRISELAFTYFLLAARKGYPSPSPAGFQLPHARLSDLEIAGSATAPLMLAGANFHGARLLNTRWRNCNLEGAVFDGAESLRSEWLSCRLAGAGWRQAKFEGSIFRDCEMRGAVFSDSKHWRTKWLRCRLEQATGLPAGSPQALYALCGDRRVPALDDLKSIARLQPATGHSDFVYGCAWSPDGERIVSASMDHTLRVWDAKTGEGVLTLSGHDGSVLGCAWLADGERIVSASMDHTLRVWDAKTGESVLTLSGHSGAVNGCAWTADGKRIVSASGDGTLRVWDAKTGESVLTLSGHSGFVLGCAWSADGERIVSASGDHTLRVWDAKTGKSVLTLSEHGGSVNGCAWSADGERIVSASWDKTLRVWDAKTGESVLTLSGHSGSVNGCAWSGDGERIVSASTDKTLRVWDAQTGESVLTLSGHSDWLKGCAWSGDGERIVSASDDKTLRVWDAKTGESVLTLSGHSDWLEGCAWSGDGERIVSASDDKTLRVWDAQTGESLLMLSGHSDSVNGCAWSGDGERIVSASDDKTLRVWDAKTGESVLTLSGHSGSVQGCAWSGDGERIVSASDDKTLRVWDAKTGESVLTLSGHDSTVLECAWSGDGERIVSASWDKTLRVWDAQTGESVLTLNGHDRPVNGCAWSADGGRIVSASWDNTLRIWDAQTGKSVLTLIGHGGPVNGCAWSADGERIVSASWDGTLRIWDARTGRLLAPVIHQFARPFPSWCAIDPLTNQILACDGEAWRYLGWVVPSSVNGMPEILPAEVFGPLPVVEERAKSSAAAK